METRQESVPIDLMKQAPASKSTVTGKAKTNFVPTVTDENATPDSNVKQTSSVLKHESASVEEHRKEITEKKLSSMENLSDNRGINLAPESSDQVNKDAMTTSHNRLAALSCRTNTSIVIENAPIKREVDLNVPHEIINMASNLCKVNPETDGATPRPRICLDINNSGQDMLHISGIPKDMTYDRLLKFVGTFGQIEALNWDSSDPFVCEVIYADPTAAREAIHYLDDAMVGGDTAAPLRAKLRSREPGAQLFVGDLVPSVTEDMLEKAFEKIVGSKVTATLKRDPETNSPIGYGFLSFQSEAAANIALVSGHRMKVGEASIRVGRAERNTYLYVTDLAPSVEMSELTDLFGKFGELVDEDTVIVRRSYAFIRFKDRLSAERAKRTLDKTDLQGKVTIRYADAEQHKACISVQFHSSVPKPPHSLRELLLNTFSKYGNCSVEIPRQRNGMWRKAAFVTFHGHPVSATLAATLALQNVRFVSTVPVMCQWAREILPRVPPRDLRIERRYGSDQRKSGSSAAEAVVNARLRVHSQQNATTSAAKSNIAPSTLSSTDEGSNMMLSHMRKGPTQGEEYVPVYLSMSAFQQMSMPCNVPDGGFPGHFLWQVPHSAIQDPAMRSPPVPAPMGSPSALQHPYADPHHIALHGVGAPHNAIQHQGNSHMDSQNSGHPNSHW